jgi:predicted N-acetyltransferase YhbS
MHINSIPLQAFDETASLLGKAFANYEPLCKHLKLTEEEFANWAHVLIERSYTYDLTLIARDDNDKIMGVIVAEPHGLDIPSFPEAQPIFDMLENLYEGLRFHGNLLHVFLVGTSPDAMGKGVCLALCNAMTEKARNLGYTGIVAELTSPGTQHVFFQKLGFSQVKDRIEYDTYDSTFKGCNGSVVLAFKSLIS